MSKMLWILGAAGAAAAALFHSSSASAANLFAQPSGPPARVATETATSGTTYRVSTWPPNAQNKVYVLAEMAGVANCSVAFLQDRATGKREPAGIVAPVGQQANGLTLRQMLEQDWGVS